MKIKILLVFLLIISVINCAFSFDLRKGFIISQLNDTVFGNIIAQNDIEYLKSVTFYDNSGYKTKYTPDDIKAFFIEDDKRLFESKDISTNSTPDRCFLICLIKGEVSLYEMTSSKKEIYFMQSKDKFLKLSNTPIEKVINGNLYNTFEFEYVPILKSEIQIDCPELLTKVDDLRFNEKDLTAFFEKYNYSLNKNLHPEVYSAKGKIRFKTGLTISANSIYTLSKGTFYYNGWGWGTGLIEEVRYPHVAQNFFFDLGIEIETGKYKGDYFISKYKYYNISLPFYLGYEPGSHNLQPFIIAGFQFTTNVIGKFAYTDYPEVFYGPSSGFTFPFTIGTGLKSKNLQFMVTLNSLESKFQFVYFLKKRT